MIGAVLSLITSRSAGPLALVGCAVLAFMLVGTKLETGKVKADLRSQVAESKRLSDGWEGCKKFTAELDASLTVQNAAVGRLEATGSQLSAAATKAASDARSARAVAESRARELAGLKSAPTCEARGSAVADLVKELTR